MMDFLQQHRLEILEIAARYGARNVRVFGSVARGDATATSDIDLLVEFEAGRSYFDEAGLVVALEDLLGRTVDVVNEPELKDRVRRRVLEDVVAI